MSEIQPLQPLQPNIEDLAQYKRVEPQEAAKFFRLRREGLTIAQIAHLCARSAETVHRHLEQLMTDTTEDARKVLKAGAVDAALRVRELVESDDGRVANQAVKTVLEGAELLGKVQAQAQVGIVVHVGTEDAPAGHDPLGNHNGHYQTQTEGVALTAQQVTGDTPSPFAIDSEGRK